MSIEKRVIKKYPNRRLYDTATSSYITLTDVKQLVLERGLKLPQPTDLLGSTVQQGLIRQSLRDWVQVG